MRDSFDLVLRTNPENAGIVSGAGRYACGDTVEIDAIATIYYNFLNWSDTLENILTNQTKHTIIMKNDSVLIANFDEIENNIIIRWDSVINKEPNDIISLHAYIESIDLPIFYDRIDVNIVMEYKLFWPLNLYFIDNNDVEHPIDFERHLAERVTATIPFKELKSGEKLLRFEGLTLAYHPTETPVTFDSFNIITEQKYRLTLLEGFLHLDFCMSEIRGSLVFLPEFDAEIENIVDENILKIDFNADGEVTIDIEITDVKGNIIHSNKHNLEKGNSTQEINLINIASGKYFIRFSTFYHTITKQILIVR